MTFDGSSSLERNHKENPTKYFLNSITFKVSKELIRSIHGMKSASSSEKSLEFEFFIEAFQKGPNGRRLRKRSHHMNSIFMMKLAEWVKK